MFRSFLKRGFRTFNRRDCLAAVMKMFSNLESAVLALSLFEGKSHDKNSVINCEESTETRASRKRSFEPVSQMYWLGIRFNLSRRFVFLFRKSDRAFVMENQ